MRWLVLIVALGLNAQSLFFTPTGGAGAAPTPSHYWTLNESSGTRVDSYGGNNLTDVNNNVPAVAGLLGNAAQFNGNATRTLRLATPITVAANVNMTVTHWVKCSSFTNQGFWGYNFVANQFTRAFLNGSAQGFFADNDNRSSNTTGNYSSLSTSSWHLFAWVVTGHRIDLYVDGSSAFITSGLTGSVTLYNVGQIGGNTLPTSCAMQGIGMWETTALSSSQINYIYNGGSGRAL